ncbi:DUF1360 domain-containing protein [Fervidibacillus halotolerans]|uniref:DUF1360 domain-containing protein n=1 Tax=Fervidibacillus halotolerans TaxID=2980027 RepID=A0A9E8S125_9BACI|nr:DUF1360 domain-containing protein [Fervidibacillus halotolerans]WAA13082.1 DUF1360 domain-containing protein [Fervidibacillus halotolerans]
MDMENIELEMGTFLLFVLASFRLTRLIVFDKITEFIRRPFMEEVTEMDEKGEEVVYIVPKSRGIRKWVGELLACYWCTGIWVSAFLLLIYYIDPYVSTPILLLFAIAGAASLIETVIGKLLGQ